MFSKQRNVSLGTLSAALLLALATVNLARADEQSFGRAGGPVGAELISKVVRSATTPVRHGSTFDKVYGNAGGRVGSDAIEFVARTAQPSKAPAELLALFGRAGGPLGPMAIRSTSHTKVVQAR